MKRAFIVIKTQITNRLYFIDTPIKHIVKHKIASYILAALFFVFLFDSCKTCKCPAYSQNNINYEELELRKISISHNDSLFAIQYSTPNNRLNH